MPAPHASSRLWRALQLRMPQLSTPAISGARAASLAMATIAFWLTALSFIGEWRRPASRRAAAGRLSLRRRSRTAATLAFDRFIYRRRSERRQA